ncbi:hypothetical protein CWE15_09620 [Aliidiomarina taiwanensis]|uniref:ABC transporter domain-containing protein n=1 Tax=Aliidiomarina taiwanensis TaxID=946228 RepID=A0A432WZX6_9GAMM|nr:ATP-binding cassette domain-containing protein [Aliidiomarina taiwanensis]RUO39371.1 hypothetical protein CWE15_09620 [Aliidiomarina taiwanensis]
MKTASTEQSSITAVNFSPTLTQGLKSPLQLNTSPGDIICFIGSKENILDTYLRALAGLHPIAEGDLFINQEPIESISPKQWSLLRQEIAYISKEAPLLSVLSGMNNVIFPALYHGIYDRDQALLKATELFAELGYQGDSDLLPAYLEPLERLQLALARALMLKPKVLVLNNPWHSLAPYEYSVLNTFLRHWSRNKVLIVSTDSLHFVRQYATKIYFIGPNKVTYFQSWTSLIESERVEVRDFLAQLSE